MASRDCLTPFAGVRYRVPWELARQRVRVRVDQGRCVLLFGLAGQEVARHERHPSGSRPAIDPAHYQGMPRLKRAFVVTLVTHLRRLAAAPPPPQLALPGLGVERPLSVFARALDLLAD